MRSEEQTVLVLDFKFTVARNFKCAQGKLDEVMQLASRLSTSKRGTMPVASSATEAALVDDETRGRTTGGSRRLPDDRGRQQQKPHRGTGPDSPRRGSPEIVDDVPPMERTGES